MTKRIYIKSSKHWSEVEEQARLLLEGEIQDDGDDEVLDTAIRMAHEGNLDVVFVRNGKSVTPEIAYGIRYHSGLRIRP
jgi:hypothetical protein